MSWFFEIRDMRGGMPEDIELRSEMPEYFIRVEAQKLEIEFSQSENILVVLPIVLNGALKMHPLFTETNISDILSYLL